jgi:hypothetical protein
MNSGRVISSGLRIWLIPVFAFGLTLFAPGLFADPLPACGVNSVAFYQATNFACTLGDFTIDDFSFSDSGANLLDSSAITVTPITTLTSVSLEFSGTFAVTGDQSAQYIFQYNLDPVVPKITGPSLNLGPGDPPTLTGEFCGNGLLVSAPNTDPNTLPTCSGNAAVIFSDKLQVTGNDKSINNTFFNNQLATTLDSRLILDLTDGASVTSFGSGANLAAVPEPSTSLLLIPGLWAFLGLRKRKLAPR